MSMHSSRREVTLETEEVERTQIQVARAYQRVESSDRQRPSRGDLWFYRVEKKGRNGSVGPEESALYQKIRTGYPGRVTMSSEGSCSGVMDFFSGTDSTMDEKEGQQSERMRVGDEV